MTGGIFVSKAPDDPAAKEAWAKQMLRLQVAMWLPASCWCGQPYLNVDDFLAREPRAGPGFKDGGTGPRYVDTECWPAYEASLNGAGRDD